MFSWAENVRGAESDETVADVNSVTVRKNGVQLSAGRRRGHGIDRAALCGRKLPLPQALRCSVAKGDDLKGSGIHARRKRRRALPGSRAGTRGPVPAAIASSHETGQISSASRSTRQKEAHSSPAATTYRRRQYSARIAARFGYRQRAGGGLGIGGGGEVFLATRAGGATSISEERSPMVIASPSSGVRGGKGNASHVVGGIIKGKRRRTGVNVFFCFSVHPYGGVGDSRRVPEICKFADFDFPVRIVSRLEKSGLPESLVGGPRGAGRLLQVANKPVELLAPAAEKTGAVARLRAGFMGSP